MLTIRNTQINAFRHEREIDFERRAVHAIAEALTTARRPLPPDQLEPRVKAGIRRAASFQIVRECDVVDYLTAAFLFLDGFRYPEPTVSEQAFLSTGGEPADRIARFRQWAQSQQESKK